MLSDIILVLNLLILLYFIVMNTSYTMLLVFSFIDIVRHKRRSDAWDLDQLLQSPLALPISIIAPAHNESANIVDSVRSLLNLKYSEFEVIVVNDGSTDDTLKVLVDAFHLESVQAIYRKELETSTVRDIYRSAALPKLTVVDKEQGGKSDALNAGINMARYPLFCSIDADTIINRDALLKVVVPFMEDPRRTVAAGGTVRTANGCQVDDGIVTKIGLGNRLLPLFQTIEYLRAFLFGRIGWNLLGGNLIISGAFGLFRKDAVISAGGYSRNTVGEDMELVIRLHRYHRKRKIPYRIVFVPDPICFTEVPESMAVLSRQRDRWQRGLMESLAIHRGLTLNPRYGAVGLLAFPFYILFEMLGPLIELSGYVMVVISFIYGIVDLPFLFMFFLVALLYGVFLSIATVLLEEISFALYRSNSSLLWLSLFGLLENFGYRQLTLVWRLKGIVKFFFGAKGWGRMDRKGFSGSMGRAA